MAPKDSSFLTNVRSEDALAPVDISGQSFVGLYCIATVAFPLGEWFFVASDGVPHSLKGDPGAPVIVITLTDLDDDAEIITALGLVAGTNDGETFTLIDAAGQTANYTWFTAAATPDSAFIVAGSSGTFIGIGPRWIATQMESNANTNRLRNFYLTPALRDAAIDPNDWHGIMPIHVHNDAFSNTVGQWYSVHGGVFAEFFTDINHSGAYCTSLRNGADMSIAVDPAEFNVSGGRGYKVDFTDPSGQVIVENAFWDDFDNQTLNLADLFTSIAIDWNNTTGVATLIKKGAALFTPAEHRDLIVIGTINHSNGVSIISVEENPLPSYNFPHTLMDFVRAHGGITQGLQIELLNSNLTWATAAGSFTLPNVNYKADKMSPSTIVHAAANPVPSFNYNYGDGTGPPPTGWIVENTNVIDPDFFDDFSGTLAAVPAGKWTIQVDFRFGQQNFHVLQYGQTVFDTKEDALAAVNSYKNTFERNSDLATAVIAGYFVVQEGATDLQDTDTAVYAIPADDESIITATGNVFGPASAIDSNLAAFDGTDGKMIKDSLIPLNALLTVGFTSKASDTSRANNNTPSADPDLVIALLANTTYVVRGTIYATSTSAAPDILLGFNVPAGTTIGIGMVGSRNNASGAQHGAQFDAGGNTQNVNITSNGISIIMLDGIINVGGTPGNLELIWSQNSLNAIATVLRANSYLEVSAR